MRLIHVIILLVVVGVIGVIGGHEDHHLVEAGREDPRAFDVEPPGGGRGAGPPGPQPGRG